MDFLIDGQISSFCLDQPEAMLSTLRSAYNVQKNIFTRVFIISYVYYMFFWTALTFYHVNRAFLSAVKYPFSAKSVLNSMSPLR